MCGDDRDLINGKPTGSVRISFGYMSTIEDAQHCLTFICDCFMENKNKPNFAQDVQSKQYKCDVNKSFDSVITEEQSHVSDCLSSSVQSNEKQDNEQCDLTLCSNKDSDQKTDSHCTKDLQLVLKASSPPNHIVTNICLYPVKSCGAFEVRYILSLCKPYATKTFLNGQFNIFLHNCLNFKYISDHFQLIIIKVKSWT